MTASLFALVRFVPVLALGLAATACVVRSDHRHDHDHDRFDDDDDDQAPRAPAPPAAPSAPGSTQKAPPAVPVPVVVQVDTDKTMEADPGQGVGVFTEYGAGGHWSVWWTCDTAKTGQACAFDLTIKGVRTNLTNVAQEADAASQLSASSDPVTGTIQATSRVTTGLGHLRFDSAPGATIEIAAKIGGVSESRFFFFVQNGQVNGGYDGKLTNPLRFEGSTP